MVPGPLPEPPTSPQSSASLWDRGVTRRHLQRVTAIAFPHPEDAARWQRAQDEAATRDHRRIGKVSGDTDPPKRAQSGDGASPIPP